MNAMPSCRAAVLALGLALAGTSAVAGGLSKPLILSSAWCSFSYNQISGRSSTTRIRFNANGTFVSGQRGEGVSSGANGSVYSQSSGGDSGYWKVDGGELFMSDGGALQHVQTQLRRNSNGYPIIVGDGVEYSQCN